MKIPDDYAAAVEVIRKHFDGAIRPFMTNDFGREKKEGAISLIVDSSQEMNVRKMLRLLREELPPGHIVFMGTDRWLGEETHIVPELVIARANSQFEALTLAGSCGLNQDITTDQVIRKLKEYDAKYGIDVYWARTDAVEFKLETLPDDLDAYLDDQAEAMKVSTQPREKVKAQLRDNMVDGFWWD